MNIVGIVGAVVVLSLLAILTITGVVLYYNPLLCLRGRRSPPYEQGGGCPFLGWSVFIPNLLVPSGVLESATDDHPSPWVSSCPWSKLCQPWRQMGWKHKAVPQLSALGTFPLPPPGSCTVMGLLPFPCDLSDALIAYVGRSPSRPCLYMWLPETIPLQAELVGVVW